jgi:hypothetical protein
MSRSISTENTSYENEETDRFCSVRASLPLFIHGIKRRGAKSRVETQIKMKITVARNTAAAAGQVSDGFNSPYGQQADVVDGMNGNMNVPGTDPQSPWNSPFEKIGTYKAVKIRAGMGARRRTRKTADKAGDPNSLGPYRPEEVLFLYTEVWCTDHPVRAYACARCVNRERRRAQARTPTAKKGVAPSESDEPVNGLGQKAISTSHLGLEPAYEPVDEEGLTQEDKERILLFNCGPLVELIDGECDLPARLTCYCKHHKEKTGFRSVQAAFIRRKTQYRSLVAEISIHA